ncbi:hypothetical protein AGMMS50218_15200 [Actinomycetota bacterium]|nr:hypothetical protein AGMMS50218_15200 [Actinomycetota bacterium]
MSHTRNTLVRPADGDIPDNMGVSIDFDAFPWMNQLQEWAGGLQATCLTMIGILTVVGVVMFVAGRLSSSQQVQKVSATIILWAVIAGLAIAVIFAALVWICGFDLGFGAEAPALPAGVQ